MTEKRFTFDKIMDLLLPLLMLEVFVFLQIVLLTLLLHSMGVIK